MALGTQVMDIRRDPHWVPIWDNTVGHIHECPCRLLLCPLHRPDSIERSHCFFFHTKQKTQIQIVEITSIIWTHILAAHLHSAQSSFGCLVSHPFY